MIAAKNPFSFYDLAGTGDVRNISYLQKFSCCVSTLILVVPRRNIQPTYLQALMYCQLNTSSSYLSGCIATVNPPAPREIIHMAVLTNSNKTRRISLVYDIPDKLHQTSDIDLGQNSLLNQIFSHISHWNKTCI